MSTTWLTEPKAHLGSTLEIIVHFNKPTFQADIIEIETCLERMFQKFLYGAGGVLEDLIAIQRGTERLLLSPQVQAYAGLITTGRAKIHIEPRFLVTEVDGGSFRKIAELALAGVLAIGGAVGLNQAENIADALVRPTICTVQVEPGHTFSRFTNHLAYYCKDVPKPAPEQPKPQLENEVAQLAGVLDRLRQPSDEPSRKLLTLKAVRPTLAPVPGDELTIDSDDVDRLLSQAVRSGYSPPTDPTGI